MSKLSKVVIFVLGALFAISGTSVALGQGSGTINQLSPWLTSANTIRLASTTASLRVPSLTSQDCVGTDSNGVFQAGTCTGGSSDTNWTYTNGNTYASLATSTLGILVNGTSTLATTTMSNLTVTGVATSTAANGFDITAGCFAVNGTCLTSSGGSSLLTNSGSNTYLNTGSNLQAPTFAATSTTGTSTITNALQLGSTAGANMLKVTAGKVYSSSDSVGGLVRITNTLNSGSALGIYTNYAAGGTNALVRLYSDNALNNVQVLSSKQDGIGGAGLFNCTTADSTGGTECVNIASTADVGLTTLGVAGGTSGHGVVKITAVDADGVDGNGSNAGASLISGVLSDASQGIFMTANSGVGSSTGRFLQFRNFDNQYAFNVHDNGMLGIWNATAQAMIDVFSTSTNRYGTGAIYPYMFISSPGATTRGNILAVAADGNVGIGTSSPFAKLSVHAKPGDTATTLFAIASSTASATTTLFSINNAGGIIQTATQPATSTTIVLDWARTPQQVEYQIGGAATTITVINATTSEYWGSRKLVWVCNPGTTAGALTWAGVRWIGTSPTQTTTADKCDVYSFNVTRATSTSAYTVAGTAGAGL